MLSLVDSIIHKNCEGVCVVVKVCVVVIVISFFDKKNYDYVTMLDIRTHMGLISISGDQSE